MAWSRLHRRRTRKTPASPRLHPRRSSYRADIGLGAALSLTLSTLATRAWANGAMPPLFGKELIRPLAWMMVPPGLIGFAVGVALIVVCFTPNFLNALDSSLLVFSRGVIAVVGLSTLMGSAFCLTVAAMVLFESRVLTSLAAVTCFTVLPTATALLFTAELSYAATLYARIHRTKKDGLSRALSVTCIVLAVPCGVGALGTGGVGLSIFLDTLRIAHGTSTLIWGLAGVAVSALLGLGGFALALSGAVSSTAAVLGRGAVMLFSVGVFFVSAVFVAMGFDELSRAPGMPPGGETNVFVIFALMGFVLLLLATEFGIGATLHLRVARAERTPLGKWLGGGSVAIAGLFALSSLVMFGFGVIAGLTGA